MTNAEQLLAVEEIKRLKARYFRYMDTKNWEGLRTVFTADAFFDVRGAIEMPDPEREPTEPPPMTGIDTIVDYIKSGLGPIISVHHGFMPEIEILSEDSARGIWPMTDLLRGPAGFPFKEIRGWGHYRESYRKIQAGWRIESLRLTRLLVERS